MAKQSKRQKAMTEIDRDRFYPVDEAISVVKNGFSRKTVPKTRTTAFAASLAFGSIVPPDHRRYGATRLSRRSRYWVPTMLPPCCERYPDSILAGKGAVTEMTPSLNSGPPPRLPAPARCNVP